MSSTLVQAVENRKVVPLQILLETPEFLKLTTLQRRFTAIYIDRGVANGGEYDAVEAARLALPLGTAHIDRRAWRFLHCRNIKRVLDAHFMKSPAQARLEETLVNLQKAARKSVKLGMGITPAVARALALFETIANELSAQEKS